jgi:glycosyltransferase involved in cell wall biosynthesis
MTRVLMTTDTIGGVWQYSTDLAAALAPLGVEVVLAVMGESDFRLPLREATPRGGAGKRPRAAPPQSVARPPQSAGCTIVRTNLPLDWLCTSPGPVLAAGRAIGALAREVKADLIHCNMPSLLAAGPMGVPVLAVAHGCIGTWWDSAHGTAPIADYAWLDRLNHDGLRAADAVVAPSVSYAATVARYHGLPTPPLAVHNGRTPLDLPGDAAPAPGVFTAGRLWDPVKNTALLDRVAGLLPVPFEAAGPLVGPHGETLGTQHLLAPGTLDETAIAARLAARPIFVSAATFEPFGLAVLEAAQAGCPLILSGIDTFRELWTGAALFVPDQDEAAYAAAITRVLSDQGLRHHLGEAARIRAQRYTTSANADAMASLYAGLATPRALVAA